MGLDQSWWFRFCLTRRDSAPMEVEYHRARSPEFAGTLPLSRGTYPEEGRSPTGLGIQRCSGSLAEARTGEDGVLACRRCVLVEEMCCHIEVSLKEVG